MNIRKLSITLSLATLVIGETLLASNVPYSKSTLENNTHSIDTVIAAKSSIDMPTIATNIDPIIIALDPGHDNKYLGDNVKKLLEGKLNLIMAEKLRDSLENKGYAVISTRKDGFGMNKNNMDVNKDNDVNLRDELDARSNYSKSNNVRIFCSLHENSSRRSRKFKGLEVYFFGIKDTTELNNNRPNYHSPEKCTIYSDSSRYVAEKLVQYFVDRGIEAKVAGTDLRILRNKPAPISILIEFGYLSNPTDLKELKSKEVQELYAGIVANFINENRRYIFSEKFDTPLSDLTMITSETTQELYSRLLTDFIKDNNGYVCGAKSYTKDSLSNFKTAVLQKEKERRLKLLANFMKEKLGDVYRSRFNIIN